MPLKPAATAILGGIAVLISCAMHPAGAAEAGQQTHDAKFQSTYLWQTKPAFNSPYRGPNSLSPHPELSYTLTVTAYLGWRPWNNGELYFNPEGIQGRALSNVTGLGGLTNGELQKNAGPQMRLYRARLFYRHTVGLNSSANSAVEAIESDQNQLAGTVPARRLVFTAGNLSVTDIFGTSDMSGDARTQFMNWASLTHGHFDYAADARGYSSGVAAELHWDAWSARAGRFMQPRVSNGLKLDYRIFKRYGDQFEIERRHTLAGQPGTVKFTGFRNVAHMASFADALAAAAPGTAPVLDAVRRPQTKLGWGIAFEQSLSSDLRVLARGGAHDGKSETYAFTEIDQSLFAAAALKGRAWGRAQDTLGVALARNGLSRGHRDFLAAGGQGNFLGDGQLNYGAEQVVEAYYNWSPHKTLGITLDWQRITNPAYNRDRGPVNVGSVRLHLEF